ncbi:MAG: hypothetical protein ACUVRU_12350 [Anaerolineae bacterium]
MNTNTTPEQTPASPPSTLAPALPEETRPNTKLLIGMIAGGIVFIAVTVLIIWFLAVDPQRTANIRDMFIIALAFVSVLIGALLAVLVWQLQSLIALLRSEIKPMLTNANQTVNTVRGTAVFMSDNVARPAIKAFSFLSGLRGVADAIGARARARARPRAGATSRQRRTTPNSSDQTAAGAGNDAATRTAG